MVKKTQQCLFNLRRLKKFGLSPKAITNFYRCTIESILSGCITAWYGTCSAHNRKALQRVVRGKLPAPRGQYRCITAGTERLKNSFYLKTIRLLNSHH